MQGSCFRVGKIFICSSLASRPDTDLMLFPKQSQHTDFFMLFAAVLFCSSSLFLFLLLQLYFFSLPFFGSLVTSHSAFTFYMLSYFLAKHWKGSNDLSSHLSLRFVRFGLCMYDTITVYLFNWLLKCNEMTENMFVFFFFENPEP